MIRERFHGGLKGVTTDYQRARKILNSLGGLGDRRVSKRVRGELSICALVLAHGKFQEKNENSRDETREKLR